MSAHLVGFVWWLNEVTYVRFLDKFLAHDKHRWGFPAGPMVKIQPTMQETWVWSLGWEIPRRRAWQPTLVSLLGEFQGQRSLAGSSPWGHKESDTNDATEHSRMQAWAIFCYYLFLEWDLPNWEICQKLFRLLFLEEKKLSGCLGNNFIMIFSLW